MTNGMARLLLPAVLAVFSGLPAAAQIRIGVELPSIHIRIAPDAPPPLRMEVRPYRPSQNYLWVQGYWDRQDDRWAWSPGRWEDPGHRGSSWVKPQYRREDGAYRYEPGHWSHQRLVEGDDYSRWREERGHGKQNKAKHNHGNQDPGHDDRGPRDDHKNH